MAAAALPGAAAQADVLPAAASAEAPPSVEAAVSAEEAWAAAAAVFPEAAARDGAADNQVANIPLYSKRAALQAALLLSIRTLIEPLSGQFFQPLLDIFCHFIFFNPQSH